MACPAALLAPLLALLLLLLATTTTPAASARAPPANADASSPSSSSSTTPARRPRPTLARGYSSAALADAVQPSTLPGINPQKGRPLDFPLFAGFVRVDPSGEADGTGATDVDSGRALYYVLAESADSPEDPQALVLWLNGGPGCSSVGGGFLSEQGPFFPRRLADPSPSSSSNNATAATKFALDRNPHAWNRGGSNASVIFLESPAYVGFSYSNSTLDAVVGDVRTAKDAATFLRRFVERFPKYKGVPLYVSGESYAGHYVPTLAAEILRVNAIVDESESKSKSGGDKSGSGTADSNDNNDSNAADAVAAPLTSLPLKGFLLGNPWTDATTDNTGALDYWYAHAMISAESHEEVKGKCDMATAGPLALRSKKAPQSAALAFFFRTKAPAATDEEDEEEACDDALGRAWREMGRINIYSIYKPVCREPGAAYEGMDDSEGGDNAGGGGNDNGSGGPHADDDAASLAASPAVTATATTATISSPMASQPARGASASSSSSRPPSSSSPNGDRPAPGPGGRDRKRRYDPCIGDEVEAFLNDPQVQRALHADPSLGAIPGGSRGDEPTGGGSSNATSAAGWSDCTGRIDYSRADLLSSMLPLYARLVGARGVEEADAAKEGDDEPGGAAGRWAAEALAAVAAGKATPEQRVRAGWLTAASNSSLHMWVYSGDTDGIVPVLGTRRWVEGMGLPVAQGWRAWTDAEGQVGGRRVDFASPRARAAATGGNNAAAAADDGAPALSFVTVRNSGHMVPYDSPQRGQQLLIDFLKEEGGKGGGGEGAARGRGVGGGGGVGAQQGTATATQGKGAGGDAPASAAPVHQQQQEQQV